MIKIKLNWLFVLALLPLSILFTRCDNKIDLSADYKNITISYALLNPNDPVHYFKIYKGFITDENAYVEASTWENIYYPVDSIEVRIEEYNDRGVLTRTAILDTTTQVTKEQGYFANPKQLLYFSKWTLNTEYSYRLVVKQVSTGKEIYAETNIVGNCKLNKPINQNPFNSKDNKGPKFVLTGDGSGSARLLNVAVADFYIVFHYIEVDKNTHQVVHKKVRKKMNSSFKTPQSDGDISYDDFTPRDLFSILQQQIKENDKVTRYVDTVGGKPYFCIEVQAYFANKEYQTYFNVATPNSSIVQDRLEYTNFVSSDNTAYGLLASRNCCVRTFKFDNTNGNYNEDSLVNGQFTKHLGFDYYRHSPEFFEQIAK